jgi:hypothetical protein
VTEQREIRKPDTSLPAQHTLSTCDVHKPGKFIDRLMNGFGTTHTTGKADQKNQPVSNGENFAPHLTTLN